MAMEFSKEDESNPLSLLQNELAELKEVILSRLGRVEWALRRAELTKDSTLKELEETLTAKVHDAETQLIEKEELLEVRDAELKEHKSKMDVLINRINQTESALQRAEEVKQSLKAEFAALETQLKEKEAAIQTKDSALKELEENLTADIYDLENQLREKEGLLEVRDAELKDLKPKMDVLANRITQTESAFQQVEEIKAELETQLKEKETLLHTKDSALKELEENLTAKINDAENQLREKEEFLEIRDAELKNLKSKMDLLVNRITQMESALQHAETQVTTEVQKAGKIITLYPEQMAETAEEVPGSTKAPKDTIPPGFFDRLILALTEAMGPMASLVVRDQIAGLGESMHAFPRGRLKELVEMLSQEIFDETLKIRFRRQMAKEIEESVKTDTAELKTRLKERENVLQIRDSALKELEENLTAKIHNLENRLREKEELLEIRDEELKDLKSRIGSKINKGELLGVEEPMKGQVEENSLIEAKDLEIRMLKDRMSAEIEKLKSELKEKKIMLAAQEREEWRSKGLWKIWKKG
jgi:soluble cytochrome b562